MSLDGISVELLQGIGVVGLVVLFWLMLATGRLFTRRQYDDVIHDRDEWRTEARLKDQAVSELSDQNRAMLNAFGPTLTDFLHSLRRAGVGEMDEKDGTR